MSLINDAIKQANKASKERSTGDSPGVGTAGMQTADARGRHGTGGSMTGMLIVAGIVVFVLLGGVLLLLALRGTPLPADLDAAAPTPAVPPVTVTSDAPADAPVSPAEVPRADAALSALTNPVPVPTGEPGVSVAPAAPVAAAGSRPFPELKLQGIYYRLTDPSVMINGKTLEIGDLIEEARVIKIDRKEVTLELDGQQKVLRLQ